MLKQWIIITGLGFASTPAVAQAYESMVKYGKGEEPAIVMVYNYPQQIVDNAFMAKFTDQQLSGNKSKGFYLYPNSVIKEISNSKLDYYFKTEPSGKKGQEATTAYLIMHGSANVEGVASLGNRGKKFLENMLTDVQRSNNIVSIKKQEEVLVDEERALLNLQQDQKKIEEQLAKNKEAQEAQQKIISSQKMMLDDLKAKNR